MAGGPLRTPVRSRGARQPTGLTSPRRGAITPPMRVYKILRQSEWVALASTGEIAGAPVDVADGFVHLSAPDQVAETAARHFAGHDDLVLVTLEADALDALLWEPSRGGALFPHLYRPLRLSDVVRHCPLPLGPDGHHLFPEDL